VRELGDEVSRAPVDPRLKLLKKFHGKFLPKGVLRIRHAEIMARWNSGEDHGGVTVEELKTLLDDWRGKPSPLPKDQNLSSDTRDGIQDEASAPLSRRRAELIFKKNRDGLNDGEQAELEQLQELSRAQMRRDFPPDSLIDEKLNRLEARLRGDEA